MRWATYPVTPERFDDFADVINPNRRPNHCWCLSHRLQHAEIDRLGYGSREQAMRRLCEREHPRGVVSYRETSRWAGATSVPGPRSPGWPARDSSALSMV